MTTTHQIASDFVVMSADFDADVLPVTDGFSAELDRFYGDFAERGE